MANLVYQQNPAAGGSSSNAAVYIRGVRQSDLVLTGATHEANFYQPTIVAGVTLKMRTYPEVSFGPIT